LDEDDDLRESSIKISGCPNSCGQHGIATIGFFGGGGRVGRDMYPSYMLSLGGRADGDAMLGQSLVRIPAKRVIPVILKIIEAFKQNKKPNDDLKTWIHRVVQGKDDSEIKSLNDLKKVISPLTVPPTKEEDPDFYSDYGSDTSYHTKTGKGECAA
ncbi:MAG: nitrite/sulfite reductase, partial [Nitrosopumilaceae archaeon]|nr:nitrite/sulfite reductase [Nitrosopumilaceae archaeon]